MSAPVLAAIDPATRDMAPAWFGAMMAAFTGAPLIAVSVYADDDSVDRLAGGQQGEELSRSASDALDWVIAEVLRAGVQADAMAVGASTAPRALDLAVQQAGAALLVVGSAARGQPGRITLGSVGTRMLNGSPCAVAAVPQGLDRLPRPGVIGAGFVDTAEGRTAVDGAARFADRAGARLRVLAAVLPRSWMDGGDDLVTDLRTRAEQAAGDSTGELADEPVNVDVDVREPADVLLDASGDVDFLVCGARGYGAQRAALLGGVTRRVAGEASCPVIVLARGPEVGLDALLA